MTDMSWQRLLRDADPLDDNTLPPEAADAIRRRVIAAAQNVPAAPLLWPRAVAVAATIALMIAGGTAVGLRMPEHQSVLPEAGAMPDAAGEPRQLQFSTPGGTRIIWVFNSELDLKESLP